MKLWLGPVLEKEVPKFGETSLIKKYIGLDGLQGTNNLAALFDLG